MLFNSIEFALFLPIVFCLYWWLKNNLKAQNLLLLVASYIFYGWWDWRFLFLIVFSSLIDFVIGNKLHSTNANRNRKLLLMASLCINVGFLGFFKYYDFFLQSFSDAFTLFGRPFEASRLNIVLPVGISFYTFQTLSYTIDVYRRKLEPTKDILAFFSFVSFFPQLVAGPIERATNLLPQFYGKRKFELQKAVDGCRQILWGLFKKIAIADNCAIFVNDIFSNHEQLTGSSLLIGAFLFGFQIYGDFSGYSDIAIGTSRLFGFNLMRNFKYPHFSRDVAEYWRRWHVSLSSWFRDYIYIPLGGSRVSTRLAIRNIFIMFLVSGIWHGANWTFIFWSFFNALLFIPLMISKKNRFHTGPIAEGRLFATFKEVYQIVKTLTILSLIRVFFRAESLGHAFSYLDGLFSLSLFSIPDVLSIELILVFGLIGMQITIEWLNRDREHGLEFVNGQFTKFTRWSFYCIIILVTIWFKGSQQDFFYFQF
ncbi:MAG: MBOAT family protein [Cytophagales bacterium]|nr:MBOAT family protein [Cytophagales bacterium]